MKETERRLTPDDVSRIDLEAALPTKGRRHRDLTLLAMWADVGVEEDFDGLAQGRIAFGAGPILELEVPVAITPGTTVMGNDLHLPINHVLWGVESAQVL
jgi:hypothetical protein